MAYTKIIGVYVLTHLSSGKYYVGSSGNYKARIAEHFRLLKQGRHHVKALQDLFDTDPDVEVSFFIMKPTLEEARSMEKELLEQHKDDENLLNRTLNVERFFQSGDKNHMFGRVVSQEERNQLSIQNRQYRHTDDAKQRIAAAKVGIPLSEAHKAKLASRARPVSIKGTEYPSAVEAASQLGISQYTVRVYANSSKPQHTDWFYV